MSTEIFHYVHHEINDRRRETDLNIPDLPEEKNPIFFLFPICMGISLIFCIFWLSTKYFNRRPLIALVGNAIGGILIMIGGISAMHHAQKHINLEEVSDEELLTHPIFIHNFTICIIGIFGMILYFIPAWILLDVYNWNKRNNLLSNERNISISSPSTSRTNRTRGGGGNYTCVCAHGRKNHSPQNSSRRGRSADASNPSRSSGGGSPSIMNTETEQNVQNERVILYCCCVDCYRYLKASKKSDNFTHEFQVVQVM